MHPNMLRAVFPLATTDSRFYSQVPFAVLERPANGKFNGGDIPAYLNHHKDNPSTVEMNDGQEIPAQNWVDVNNGKTGIALLNKTKYGHSYHNGELRMTLMRSAGSPDIYPNLGKFNISYSLFPHGGSGTSEEDFKSCIHNGICKINVATAIQLGVTDHIRQYLQSNANPDYIEMKEEIVKATKEVVTYHIRLFESEGRV